MISEPTPDELERVKAYMARQTEQQVAKAKRDRAAAEERFRAKLTALLVGRQIVAVEADPSSYGGSPELDQYDLTVYDLDVTLDDGTKLMFEAEFEGRAVEVRVRKARG